MLALAVDDLTALGEVLTMIIQRNSESIRSRKQLLSESLIRGANPSPPDDREARRTGVRCGRVVAVGSFANATPSTLTASRGNDGRHNTGFTVLKK
jgi:hypothetical protein